MDLPATHYAVFKDIHLTATYSGGNITQPIVVTDRFMIIVRTVFARLCSIELYSSGSCRIVADKCTASGSGNHFIAVEAKRSELAECPALSALIF